MLTGRLHMAQAGEKHHSFLYRVYASTREEEVEAWGWEESFQQAFLRMQYDLQKRSYESQYPDAENYILMKDDFQIGVCMLVRKADRMILVNVALLPAFRNSGYGTYLLQELQEEAAEKKQPIQLHVMRGNEALRLYERLGFHMVEEQGMHILMEWKP
ncbi:GNAT family N-acetyltransferase [Paenibacillus sp. Leaf72]|uniref:GNAT family N-acetyltransferase n=1 Tax=Paenibacillus sp. Leaf72 TaxID=1736234 RepID=UPI0009D64BF4|nr:GNAT family N-acetyltransferase [Paenibacillus sp. Leaf72]